MRRLFSSVSWFVIKWLKLSTSAIILTSSAGTRALQIPRPTDQPWPPRDTVTEPQDDIGQAPVGIGRLSHESRTLEPWGGSGVLSGLIIGVDVHQGSLPAGATRPQPPPIGIVEAPTWGTGSSLFARWRITLGPLQRLCVCRLSILVTSRPTPDCALCQAILTQKRWLLCLILN